MGGETAKILLIGLDNSGKTTILSRLLQPNILDPNITPTIGFKKNSFSRNGVDFQILDMSGQSKYRDLWQSNAVGYKQDRLRGIIFVVDASNKMRLNVARSQLQLILQNKMIPNNIPFLFYSNKMDVNGAIQVQEVNQILKLSTISRNHRIYSCSGISGKGIQQGMQWFSQVIKAQLQARP